jgi:hypothetical protein
LASFIAADMLFGSAEDVIVVAVGWLVSARPAARSISA